MLKLRGKPQSQCTSPPPPPPPPSSVYNTVYALANLLAHPKLNFIDTAKVCDTPHSN